MTTKSDLDEKNELMKWLYEWAVVQIKKLFREADDYKGS